jgi:hypothetical protein
VPHLVPHLVSFHTESVDAFASSPTTGGEYKAQSPLSIPDSKVDTAVVDNVVDSMGEMSLTNRKFPPALWAELARFSLVAKVAGDATVQHEPSGAIDTNVAPHEPLGVIDTNVAPTPLQNTSLKKVTQSPALHQRLRSGKTPASASKQLLIAKYEALSTLPTRSAQLR